MATSTLPAVLTCPVPHVAVTEPVVARVRVGVPTELTATNSPLHAHGEAPGHATGGRAEGAGRYAGSMPDMVTIS